MTHAALTRFACSTARLREDLGITLADASVGRRACALKRIFAPLRDDERGASAIELGVSLPILMMLTVGAVDVSNLISARLDLEQAAQRTTDLALASRPRTSNGAYLVTEAAAASGQPAANVTVDIFLECEGVRQPVFSAPCEEGEARARFASVSIRRDYQPMFDYKALGALFGRRIMKSTITIEGDSVVRFQ
jgi:Flp pilus assembly pilin Flp